jgi:dihydropteroate synthase
MNTPAETQPILPAALNVRVLQPANRAALVAAVAAIESYPQAVERVAAKAYQRLLRLDAVAPHAAMLLKQELLAAGGDALITPEVYLGTATTPTPVLAWASERGWSAICQKLAQLPLPALQHIGQAITATLETIEDSDRGELRVGQRVWRWGERTLVMGIVNLTPDSFSGDGLLRDASATRVAEQIGAFAQAGADILDIGGESTRPGAAFVSASEELERVIPAIKIARRQSDLPISIDTYTADVARQALDAGADLINDIWGLRTPDGGWNTDLARLVAERGVPIVLMHNRRAAVAETNQVAHFTNTAYQDLAGEIAASLQASIAFAFDHGIAPGNIILDPGLGFGKTPAQNIELLQHLAELRALGYPLLVGSSRKSFIGLVLDKPAEERVFGTAATVSHAIERGADIVRVHDVAAMVDVCRMSDALVRRNPLLNR